MLVLISQAGTILQQLLGLLELLCLQQLLSLLELLMDTDVLWNWGEATRGTEEPSSVSRTRADQVADKTPRNVTSAADPS